MASLNAVEEVPSYEEISVEVPWGTMAAKCWNPKSSKTIVGVHGWQDNANTFDTVIPLLPKEIKFIILDLPGHGKSSRYPLGTMYEIQRYIMSLHFFVKGLNLDKFSLMGHSLGGAICALYSGTFPDKVHKLIMVEAICAATGDPSQIVSLFAEGINSFVNGNRRTTKFYPTVDAAMERLKFANNSLTDEAARILIERGTIKSEEGYTFARDPVLQQNTLRLTPPMQLEIVSRIKAKTLIIFADDGIILRILDQTNLTRFLDAFKKNTASLEHVRVPGKHHLHLTDPESVSQIISDFLKDIRTGEVSL